MRAWIAANRHHTLATQAPWITGRCSASNLQTRTSGPDNASVGRSARDFYRYLSAGSAHAGATPAAFLHIWAGRISGFVVKRNACGSAL
jgi:hypothetical protein